MRSIVKGLMTAVALTALAAAPVRAYVVPITDGNWTTFDFLGVGSQFQDLYGDPLDFTFTLTHPDTFTVTDGYNAGDQFGVVISEQAPFSLNFYATSTPGNPFDYVGDDWSAALRDPNFSSIVIPLSPGIYDVSGYAIQSPFYAGEGAVLLGSAPEPEIWVMMLAGLGAIGGMMRSSRRKHEAAVAV